MTKRLDKLAESLGSAMGTYQKALHTARFGRRHQFFTSLADEGRWRTRSGQEEIAQRRAMQNSWVFAAVALIARTVSAAEFQVVKYQGVDKKPVQVPNHDLEEMLRRPNPYMGGSFLWRYSSWWLELDGNSYWWFGLDPMGRLAEIWPLPAEDIEIVPGDAENLIKAYEYTVQGTPYEIPAEYVLHFMLPNPHDIFRGMSPLVAAILAADSDIAMSRWNARFFGRDNVMPSAIINLSSGDAEQPIDPADADALREDLKAKYTAFDRKTAVTTAYKLEVEQLGWNPRDMDFLQGRQFSKEEIYEIYGIPGGLYDKNATYANSENARRVFNNWTLWPLLVLIAEQMTAQLVVPFYGDEYAGSFADVRMEAREAIISELGVAGSYLTIDEVRGDFYKKKPLPDDRGKLTATEAQAQQTAFGGPEEEWAEQGPPEEPPEEQDERGQLPEGERPPMEKPQRLTGPEQLAVADVKRWRRKALNYIKKGKPVPISFVSDVIPWWVVSKLRRTLGKVREWQQGGLLSEHDATMRTKAAFADVLGKKLMRMDSPAFRKVRVSDANILAELKAWERMAVRSVEAGGVLRPNPSMVQAIPPNVAVWVRTELADGPGSVEAVRSVFEEVTDFLFPFSLKTPLGKKRRRPWERWEAHLRQAVNRVLAKRAKELARTIRERGEGFLGDDEFWSRHRRSLFEAVLEGVSGIARLGIRHGDARLGRRAAGLVDWDLVNRDAANWARQYSYSLVTGITSTIQDDLRSGVSSWIESGAGLPALVRIATGIVDDPERGRRIAETEATRAYAEGNDRAWTAAGVQPAMYKPPAHVRCRCYPQPYRMSDGTMVQVWYTARDERVCVQPLRVPWSARPVKGCKALHRVVISRGDYLGTKIRSKR